MVKACVLMKEGLFIRIVLAVRGPILFTIKKIR